jgi:hypothetical protein
MKEETEILDALTKVEDMKNYAGMTYKEGLERALRWVLEMDDDGEDITE